MPSSIAVATRETIRPEFTSASVNCGMALLTLDTDVPGETTVRRFFDEVRRRYPHPPGWRRELSVQDVLSCAEQGAEFGVERYGLHPEALERIEEGGRLDLDRYGGVRRLRRELPALSFQLSRLQVRHDRAVQPLRRSSRWWTRSSIRRRRRSWGWRPGS